jgi:hypothetical protein
MRITRSKTLGIHETNPVEDFTEVVLKNPDDFLRVRETLTRIGIISKRTNTLWQSCHILHKRGKYYIVHFKRLFLLDGKETEFTEDDLARENRIVKMLEDWNLVNIVDPEKVRSPVVSFHEISVISFKEKSNYTLQAKYTIGNNMRKSE